MAEKPTMRERGAEFFRKTKEKFSKRKSNEAKQIRQELENENLNQQQLQDIAKEMSQEQPNIEGDLSFDDENFEEKRKASGGSGTTYSWGGLDFSSLLPLLIGLVAIAIIIGLIL